ncbi:putative transmembrane protein [Helianthus annuus]|nr:putative transmembrane protein [Helianthus annuus]KAJ0849263.1 putative transmembrane protein [Helianthus annuus]
MLKRVPFLLLFLAFCFFLSNEESQFTISQSRPSSGSKRLLGDEQKNKNASLVLAQERTTRKDPLNKFRKYKGGWNIKERHYWASVAFTGAPFFVVGAIWFVIFGLFLSITCFCYCCCRKEPFGYSKTAYTVSLVLLILFTITTIVGCIVLYTGQGKFNSSTKKALKYIAHQAEITAKTLGNVSDDLAAAKKIAVAQVFLPVDVQADIDKIQTKLNASAIELSKRTEANKKDIQKILRTVRIMLIVISVGMLLLTFIGLMFSILGMQCIVYTLVLFGWIFVTLTFILCSVFLCLHNATADSCEAMNQWVQNPTAHTTLDDILPCVDNTTAHDTSKRSKEVTVQLITVINQVIRNVTNGNFAPSNAPLYYNQSGPTMPPLCNPFNPDFTNRTCEPGEVPLSNASSVYSKYVCQVSSNQICTTTGRLTPDSFNQMSAGIELGYSLWLYGPFLVDLQDCTFVRKTFTDISRDHCPGLCHYLNWIYVGLLMVSLAVMFSLVCWVIYARERRHRVYTNTVIGRSGRGGEKDM